MCVLVHDFAIAFNLRCYYSYDTAAATHYNVQVLAVYSCSTYTIITSIAVQVRVDLLAVHDHVINLLLEMLQL